MSGWAKNHCTGRSQEGLLLLALYGCDADSVVLSVQVGMYVTSEGCFPQNEMVLKGAGYNSCSISCMVFMPVNSLFILSVINRFVLDSSG